MTVKVVTDSTSDLPRELADRYGINVIPQKVIFGTEELRDGVDITGDEFYRRVSGSAVLPTTSQASPGEFRELYESIADGADGIVSVHVSAALSGTVDSARSGGEQADIGCSVEVIDSKQAGMGTGLVAIAAARAAMNGGDLQQVVSVAEGAVGRSETYVLLDTLEYLQKGGRIGKARAMLATLLSIKPMIILREGIVDELGKERTHKKGVARLRRVTEDFAPLEELCVNYTTTPDEARAFAEQLQQLLPDGTEPLLAQIGPAVGTYTGPAALGVSLLRAEDD
ncbi:MAG: DegV family protein [Chloroflexi bacterium]|nr:DegV family protein [Chloroflexota bacterium]